MRLAHVILWHIAEAPTDIRDLDRWVRLQWPRILPEAIGTMLCALRRVGLVEVGEDGRWRVQCGRRPE